MMCKLLELVNPGRDYPSIRLAAVKAAPEKAI